MGYVTGYTIEKLQLLEESIAEGVLRVKYTDKEVEYRSLDDMLKTAALMRKKLGLCNRVNRGAFGGSKKIITTSKGL